MIPSSDFKYCNFEFEYFNPLQMQAYSGFTQDCNMVVSAHVCAGKTVIHEAIAAYELSRDDIGKVVYVSPIKALANEKIEEWRKHDVFGKHELVELTSDNVVSRDQLHRGRIIVATIEALNICCRRQDDWIKNVRLLTFDEAHLFDHERRGSGAEAMMMGIADLVSCRFLLLSGTLGDVQKLASWVKVLNGKRTFFIDSDWRPTKLSKEIVKYKEIKDFFNVSCGIALENPKDKILIFVHSKKIGNRLVSHLREDGIKSVFYSADISFEGRKRILEEFRDDDSELKVLVGTSALAMGINL